MVRPSSKPSLVPDQASPTSSSRTRTRPQPHVPARTSFSQVQTPQVQVSSIETPKVQTPSIEAPPIQTPKSIFETPTSENFDFSYGDKRPFSVVSPSSSGDTSSKKSSAVSIHQLRDIKDRLKRLEDAYAEIFTLRNALEHSESARRALESQVVQLKAAQQGPPTKSSPPPPSAAKSSEAGTTFASVAAKNVPKPKSKAKAKKPPAPSPRRAAATIGRLFGPKAGTPSEYHFVYYKQSIRRPLKQLRASLKNIGINVSRILDIQYPEAQIFTSLMNEKGRGALPARDYDPYHPESLKDPKFGTLSFELRAQKAREIQNTRCLRSLSFVRRSARLSVARSFLYYNRINQTQFDVILAQERASRPSPPLPPPKLSPDEVVEKKKHLAYLGYLLHLDHEAAHSLAYAPPLVDETMMSD
ncbi:hypothetical protein BD770DRAFT_386271 [Pilaira anomala]|nr:hypothetical protein BD770DRAFT_386271 [Pilaira anomala]